MDLTFVNVCSLLRIGSHQSSRSIRSRRRVVVRLLLLSAAAALLLVPTGSAQVVMNEMMSSNQTTIADGEGDFSDWLELLNTGSEVLSLSGYGLSDRLDDPFRWTFPDVALEPGAFLLVWASGKDRSEPGEPLHASFRIAADGEHVILTAPDGTTADVLDPIAVPVDVSLGRWPDGSGDRYFFTDPTPGAPNASPAFSRTLNPPSFSHEAGFHADAFSLSLASGDSSAVIRFTLDGSEPTAESREYTDPISIRDRSDEPNSLSEIRTYYNPSTWLPPDGPVFKGTVVRARAFGPNARPSDVATRTFFIDEAGEQRYSLPVVSIATDREHLFDYHRGIYVPGVHYRSGDPWTGNYFMRGPDWERPVSVEMFETDGSVAFSLNAGVRIHGGFSRALPTKTLRLYARSRYDKENWITHRIFPDRPVDRFKRVLLRNSGNDWGGHPWATYNNSEPGTLFRDPMMQRLVEHLGVDTQGYRPAIVFINGEYWGIHNFRQRYDNDYFETNYDISSDRLDLLVDLGEVSVGSRSHYDAMLHLTSSGLANDESFRELETMMDVDNYTDYFIANIFFDNVDWPHKNADFWRFRRDGFNPGALPGQDGRWRWALFDTDFGFGLGGDHNPGASPYRNTLEHATQLNEGTALFRRMLQNGGYRHAFISRFADHLNSIFTTRRVTGVIDSMAAVIRPEVPEHLSRWRYPRSVFVWNGNVEVLREFARRRPDAVREHIRSRFGLAGYFDVEVDVSSTDHGTVRVNRLHLKPGSPGVSDKPYPWVGRYFQGVPVTITAVPRTGYRFARWESTVDVPQESILTLTRTDAATVVLRAVFEPDESDGMNPAAHMLAEAPYRLPEWSADRPANTFPNNMVFQQSSTLDPGLSDEMHSVWRHSYDLPARSRIVGLDGHGVAFINTSNPQEEGGGYVGAAVLAVDTENVDSVFVAWTGGTPRPNSRAYAFRLQYRVGTEEPFRDVLDRQGNPVEYRRNDREGHSAAVGPHVLPADASGRPYVQIRWKYYATGERHDDESGQRTMLRLADIVVANTASRVDHDSRPPEVERPELMPPAPNPFVEKTRVRFVLPRTGYARVAVFDVLGREVAVLVDGLVEGKSHEIMWPADDLPSGAYFLRLQAFGEVRTQQIMRLR